MLLIYLVQNVVFIHLCNVEAVQDVISSKTVRLWLRNTHVFHSIYSVMQSDGNVLCGDVVSDSFNKTSRDKDTILWVPCCYFLLFLTYAYSSITRKMKIPTDLLFIFFFLTLSSSLYTMLKLSRTTSPQKRFPSDCITLYDC